MFFRTKCAVTFTNDRSIPFVVLPVLVVDLMCKFEENVMLHLQLTAKLKKYP